MSKKVSYIQLLKEAVTEYDAKAMDYKGPLSEPILTFSGEGELDTHKDASSILERYYFNEKEEKLVESEIGPDNPVKADADEDAEDPNEIVTGEEADSVSVTMDDFEDEILDEGTEQEMKEDLTLEDIEEDLELEDVDQSDLVANDEPFDPDDKDVDIVGAEDKPLAEEDAQVMNNEMVSLENTIIEKLIQEMEEESETDTSTTAGNEEAGTGRVPEKKAEGLAEEDFDLLEAELDAAAEEEGGEDKEKDLDVDKEMEDSKDVQKEHRQLGPIKPGPEHAIEEAFQIFQEQVEDEEGEEKKEDEEKKEMEEDFDLDLLEADLELEDVEEGVEEDFDLFEGEDAELKDMKEDIDF